MACLAARRGAAATLCAAARRAPAAAPRECASAPVLLLPRRAAAGLAAAPRAPLLRAQRGWQQARPLAAAAGTVVDQVVDDFGGESITEGTVMEYRKQVGEFVAKGDVIAVIETDKVTIEVSAIESGTIKEALVPTDGTIEKGQVLVRIEAGAGGPGAQPAAAAPAPAAPAPAAAPGGGGKMLEQAVTDFGAESITEGTLMEWRKQVGDFVAKGELLAVVETDKVSLEVKAEEAGVVKEILVPTDATVEVGKALVRIEVGAAAAAGAAAPAPAPEAAAPPAAAAPAVEATGLRGTFARLAAQRLGLPVPGAAPAAVAETTANAPAASQAPTVSVGEGRTETRVPMSGARRRVAQRLKDAQDTAALLTTFQEADMSAALEMCKKYKDSFQKTHGAQLGYLSVFAKASSNALMEIPGVNAVIDDSSKEVVYRDYVDISIPIPSPRGPVSCVLRGVESMSILDIEHAIAGLVEKAANDDLSVDDMMGATFGITDTGVAGGMMGTAIINPPQSAVMGTNAVTTRPTVVGGKVVAKPIMYLALTYDHRLIDGREAVTFLCSVRDKMEDPTRMLLEL